MFVVIDINRSNTASSVAMYSRTLLNFFVKGMFVQAIKGQATEEQQKKWLPLATKMQIIGCYAQTELGHGSNVQGLETIATYDPKTDEFIIHSPTLTSTKVSIQSTHPSTKLGHGLMVVLFSD